MDLNGQLNFEKNVVGTYIHTCDNTAAEKQEKIFFSFLQRYKIEILVNILL